jgi:hypothetical protein
MRYMTPTAWLDKYFAEDSRPPEPTLRRWMQNKAVPAKKIGGSWFIDEHAWLTAGDELVERVLEAS